MTLGVNTVTKFLMSDNSTIYLNQNNYNDLFYFPEILNTIIENKIIPFELILDKNSLFNNLDFLINPIKLYNIYYSQKHNLKNELNTLDVKDIELYPSKYDIIRYKYLINVNELTKIYNFLLPILKCLDKNNTTKHYNFPSKMPAMINNKTIQNILFSKYYYDQFYLYTKHKQNNFLDFLMIIGFYIHCSNIDKYSKNIILTVFNITPKLNYQQKLSFINLYLLKDWFIIKKGKLQFSERQFPY